MRACLVFLSVLTQGVFLVLFNLCFILYSDNVRRGKNISAQRRDDDYSGKQF